MNFDNFSRNKSNIPNNRDFLKMLLYMINRDGMQYDFDITIADFVSQLQIMMRDEFNASIKDVGHNALSVDFAGGEQFIIRVEKCFNA